MKVKAALKSPQKGTWGHGTSIFMKCTQSKFMDQKKKCGRNFARIFQNFCQCSVTGLAEIPRSRTHKVCV